MNLFEILVLLRKWVWLILILVGLAAGSSYYYSRQIPPTYEATATVLVGRVMNDPNPSNTSLSAENSIADAHAILATQPQVLQATAETIHWPGQWQDLFFEVSAQAPGGQLLVITVKDGNPNRAALIANEVARQLIAQSPVSAAQKQSQEQTDFVATELKQTAAQIQIARKSLNDLTTQAEIESDAAKLADLRRRIDALELKIDDWQKNYASLSTILNSNANNFLTILTPAVAPNSPVSPNVPQTTLLGALVGLVLAFGAIFVFEYFDDTIKDAEDVQRVLNVTPLGAITRMPGIRQPSDQLVTIKNSRSKNAEAYRIVRTNLRFSGIKNPSGALLVTSAQPGEGKTTTAANLAIAIAQLGKRVVLVDADLRQPSIHKLFGLSNEVGLSSLFLGDQPSREIERILYTPIDCLHVVTSGPLPPNPAELLESEQMSEILDSLRTNCDLLILDSPPVLAYADAKVIGARCSGAVLVIDAGRTRTGVSRRALKSLSQANIKIFGAIVNKVHPSRASNSYYAAH